MTLLTTVFAAVICTVIWYKSASARELKVGALCWMFWGAALMWLGDAIFEYAELGAEYFAPAAGDMLNDLFLGLSVIALALVIWLVILLVKDPKGVVRAQLFKKV
jgi:predicted secreted protein